VSKLIPHCAFRVGPYRMALPAPSVLEVLQSAPCTPLARAPAAVLGVINLRGQIVATVDLRRCLGASTEQPLDQTMSIVVTTPGGPLCLVVDEVIDMVDADDAQLLPVPDASATAAHLYAASILALKGEILLVLDVDRVVDAVRGSAKSAA